MGSSATKDALSAMSPWNTQVVLRNQCNTPVLVFLAHDHANPRPENAHAFEVPPDADFAINSGWFREPTATLLLRTGLHEAKILHATDNCRIVISLKPHGLKVESTDDISIEDFEDVGAVRGIDTVPMFVHGNHFAEVQPEHVATSHSGVGHAVHDALTQVIPWTTQVVVDNQCNTPVLIHLADHADNPTPEESKAFTMPPNTLFSVNSAYLREPKATLLIRTGLHEAKVIHAGNKARILVSLKPHGLKVESPDDVAVEDFADPAAVRGLDTVPMIMRGQHFADVRGSLDDHAAKGAQAAGGQAGGPAGGQAGGQAAEPGRHAANAGA